MYAADKIENTGVFSKVFIALFTLNFLMSFGLSMFNTFLPVHLNSIGVAGFSFGLVFSAYAFSKILFAPFIGRYSDRVNKYSLIVFSIFLYMGTSVLYIFSTSIVMLVLIRLMQGVAHAAFRPLAVSVIGEQIIDSDCQTSLLGIFDISFYIAIGTAPLIGGIIKDQLGFRGLIVALIILSVLALLVALKSLPFCNSSITQYGFTRNNKIKVNLSRKLWGLNIFIFFKATAISMTTIFIPILLINKTKFSNSGTGLIITVSSLSMVFFLVPSARLAEFFKYQTLIVTGSFTVSCLYLFYPLSESFSDFMIVSVLVGLFSALSQPASSMFLIKEGKKAGLGSTASIFHSCMSSGFLAGPIFGSLIYRMFGVEQVFYLAFLLSAVSIIIFIFMNSEPSLNY